MSFSSILYGRRLHGFSLVGLAVLGLLLAGCAAVPARTRQALGPSYTPQNVFVASDNLPASIRRVVILPLTMSGTGRNLESGRDALGPILQTELARSGRFELVPVTAHQLRSWTGRSGWTIRDRLPDGFLARLQEETGCDAVLFSQLHQYHPYPPLAVGLTLHLVETELPRVVWAVDEIIEASDPTVATGAQRFSARNPTEPGPLGDRGDALRSPRRFGQYAAFTLVETIPAR
jgi:hypothetical protein